MIKRLLSLLLLGIATLVQAQSPNSDVLTSEFHKTRRDELRRMMPPKSVSVFFANPERNRSNDVSYRYHPDPNFYYLTGLREPNAVLFVFKDMQTINNETFNEIIFVHAHNAL